MLPVTNISTTLVGNTLNTSSRSVGALCLHPNVNMWSKRKPFRSSNGNFPSQADRETAMKKVNYGMTVDELTINLVNANNYLSWLYLKPRGTVYNEPYRLGDFAKYNHDSICPMLFEFPNGSTEYIYNTATQSQLPVIKVRYRLNDSKYSYGMSAADITMEDINVDGVTTGSIGEYLACVTNFSTSNSGLQVANTKDTLNLKYGEVIDNMVIDLNSFTIKNSFVTDNTNYTYPSGATNKQILYLYPRINRFTPSGYGLVYKVNGAPSALSNNEGYFTTSTYPFITPPLGKPLVIRRYTKPVLNISYNYISSISNGNTMLVNTWPWIRNNDPYTASGIRILGGQTIRFKTQAVSVIMSCTVYNNESTAITVRPRAFQGSIFPRTVSLQLGTTVGNISTEQKNNGIRIEPNSSAILYVGAYYSAGVADDFTFPSIPSPGFGVESPGLTWEYLSSSGWATEFTPGTQGDPKQLRWR